ncbi:MAG: RimJ/RimL family protein N-acetyltransferase [Patescibacteria group bacterium]|jgi:RimJ/RimL family protein N-acetyltransferase
MNLQYKNIQLRLVEPSDAEFILSLRLDYKYNRYLSKVAGNVEDQRNWIENYKSDEASGIQYYFVIERLDGTPCGTIRIYDIRDESFCWGSWILNHNKTKYAALESAFLIYRYGFDLLGFEKSHFEVIKENVGVVNFHKRMGAQIVQEDEVNFYFEITKDAVRKAETDLSGVIQ